MAGRRFGCALVRQSNRKVKPTNRVATAGGLGTAECSEAVHTADSEIVGDELNLLCDPMVMVEDAVGGEPPHLYFKCQASIASSP